MKHFDSSLRAYAASGLRTTEDWASIGRQVIAGAEPRTTATVGSATIPLYVREQTERRPRVRRPRPEPVAAPVVAPAADEAAEAPAVH